MQCLLRSVLFDYYCHKRCCLFTFAEAEQFEPSGSSDASDVDETGITGLESKHIQIQLHASPFESFMFSGCSFFRNLLMDVSQKHFAISEMESECPAINRWIVASLLLVAMPFVTSSILLVVVRPGAPSSVLAPID